MWRRSWLCWGWTGSTPVKWPSPNLWRCFTGWRKVENVWILLGYSEWEFSRSIIKGGDWLGYFLNFDELLICWMFFKDDWQPSTRKEREPDHRPKPRSAFNCTSYLLIFYFEPSNADKARADCISRQVLGWLLKCLKMARLYREQKSLFVSHADGIFLIFCLEYGPNTCATLNVEPVVKFEIYFPCPI